MADDSLQLKKRWISGFIIGTLVVATYLHYYSFIFLGVIISLLCGYEYLDLIFPKGERKDSIVKFLFLPFFPLLSFLAGFFLISFRYDLIFVSFGMVIPLFSAIGLLIYRDFAPVKDRIIDSSIGILYISFSYFLGLYTYRIFGWQYALLSITLPWLFDSLAFFVGVRFGRIRIMPSVSPKKSLEGVLGGLFLSIPSIWLYVFLLGFFSGKNLFNFWQVVICSIVLAASCVFGDLFESSLKRFYSRKDIGKLLPGHGGLLDRVDSLLFFIPAFLLMLIILGL